MHGNCFIEPRKFSELRMVITLHFPLLKLNLKKNTVHFRQDHFVLTLCFLKYSSDMITASQIAR